MFSLRGRKKENPHGGIRHGGSLLVRKMGLEPTRHRHTHLKRACLPVPALSHIHAPSNSAWIIIASRPLSVNTFCVQPGANLLSFHSMYDAKKRSCSLCIKHSGQKSPDPVLSLIHIYLRRCCTISRFGLRHYTDRLWQTNTLFLPHSSFWWRDIPLPTPRESGHSLLQYNSPSFRCHLQRLR